MCMMLAWWKERWFCPHLIITMLGGCPVFAFRLFLLDSCLAPVMSVIITLNDFNIVFICHGQNSHTVCLNFLRVVCIFCPVNGSRQGSNVVTWHKSFFCLKCLHVWQWYMMLSISEVLFPLLEDVFKNLQAKNLQQK